jgi:two-component system, OmpR family, sensor histidine kinase ResE
MEWILFAAAGAALLTGLAVAGYTRWQSRKLLDSLEDMLRAATEGEFTESAFDETRMSRLETELAHYLSASAMSARNVEREKEKIKTLIVDISHQTKTPIANLLLYSELLAEEELTQTAREKLAALHGQTEKLQFLIEALVKLSRLENGIIRLRPEDHAVSYLFERVREQYEAKAQQKGLSLTVQETELHAVFDPGWTVEALANLVDNAVKYTKSGEVALSAVAYEMFVRIDVKDTGMGIAEEEQGKIFSRFYRSQSAGESSDGVGIGLYLTREIVSGEGGYLRVQSAVGEGSLFSMYLPRE